MDMTESLAAKSDQLNAVDIAQPITVTIQEVRKGSAEQPFEFHLEGMSGRPYKPSKGMRRVIVACWGPDTSVYGGRRMTLFNEPTVTWAGQEIGGIRVSHLSHIDGPVKTSLTLNKKQRTPYTVQPLADAPAPSKPTPEPIEVRIPKAVAWFAGKGVELSSLEAHVNSVMDEWAPADLDTLMAARDELVELNAQAPEQGEVSA